MSTPTDPAVPRAGVGDAFDSAVAGFATWTPLLWDPVGAATVDAAGPRPADRVLDACCGNGSAAIPAAHAVGPEGLVDAVDLSANLLAAGRERSTTMPWLRFHHADAATWPGTGYDVLTCVFGVFFLPDPDAGTRHLVAGVRPGGRAAVTVWARGSVDPLIVPFLTAVGRERPLPPPGPLQRTSEQLADPGRFARWLGETGLVDVDVVTHRADVPVDPDLCWALVTGSATAGLLLGLDDPAVARVRDAYREAVAGVEVFRVAASIGTGRRATSDRTG
ncbi:ubiquinone/menaquinone biosynthesis C-methylase UbiE [Pseudonocardia sediminis]|uniref:Ubiquinone/menaquinone biosynthesis C-methylase UbiE n=1 Tax=Pseudonocardia sediminis TaxID=1397368 RepID=A0A4Q7UY70_PSEST|nr:methyltransferase domain-containing protein [Pseudonocardia sediminis]RZT86018.1 ubiquinone/menaquinone biosynthesis C-methylase UbiE [Pseudonocardia sediminis]